MILIGDPVRARLVPSLARPGGNITGNTILGAKRLQILKEAIPTVSRVAFLFNPDNASNVLQFEEIQAADTDVRCDGHPRKRELSHRVRDRIRRQ
jgi:putative ABC transport system substrate-binding protein